MSDKEKVLSLLRKCGHYLHHSNNLNVNQLFAALSKQQLQQLFCLLKITYDNWNVNS